MKNTINIIKKNTLMLTLAVIMTFAFCTTANATSFGTLSQKGIPVSKSFISNGKNTITGTATYKTSSKTAYATLKIKTTNYSLNHTITILNSNDSPSSATYSSKPGKGKKVNIQAWLSDKSGSITVAASASEN